jgi:hypothetical protein
MIYQEHDTSPTQEAGPGADGVLAGDARGAKGGRSVRLRWAIALGGPCSTVSTRAFSRWRGGWPRILAKRRPCGSACKTALPRAGGPPGALVPRCLGAKHRCPGRHRPVHRREDTAPTMRLHASPRSPALARAEQVRPDDAASVMGRSRGEPARRPSARAPRGRAARWSSGGTRRCRAGACRPGRRPPPGPPPWRAAAPRPSRSGRGPGGRPPGDPRHCRGA